MSKKYNIDQIIWLKFDISPIVEGRATIKATYQGKTKIFLIN